MQYKSTTIAVLLGILLIILSSVAAADQPTPVKIILGGTDYKGKNQALIIDGSAYVPVAFVKELGAELLYDESKKKDGMEITVTPAEGDAFKTPARLVDGVLLLPIKDIAYSLGVDADFDNDTKTLTVSALIKSISFDGSKLQVNVTMPVKYEVAWWKAENRLIIRLQGVRMPRADTLPPIDNSTDVPIRIGKDVVFDMPCPVQFKVMSGEKSSIVSVLVTGLAEKSGSDKPAPAPGAEKPAGASKPPVTVVPPVTIKTVDYKETGADKIEIKIESSGIIGTDTVSHNIYKHPTRLIIDINNAQLQSPIRKKKLDGGVVDTINVEQRKSGTVRVTMGLNGFVIYEITPVVTEPGLKIALQPPKGSGGRLKDKRIVIDPGHGGFATGCIGVNGLKEKDYNLEIALKVADRLKEAGAKVFMTRETDVDLTGGAGPDERVRRDLEARVEYAADMNADFFISIHCNSCVVPAKRSGTETYYHGGDLSGRALAESVHPELVKVLGLPDASVRSDFDPLKGGRGFSVLRNSTNAGIVGILIEVGFLNHPVDASKITDPDVQDKVADAVVRGLKDYIENGSPGASEKEEKKPEPKPEVKPKEEPKKKPEVKKEPDEGQKPVVIPVETPIKQGNDDENKKAEPEIILF